MTHDVEIKHPFDKRRRAILRIYPVRLDLKNRVLTGLVEILSRTEAPFKKDEVILKEDEFEHFMMAATTIESYTLKVLEKLNLTTF